MANIPENAIKGVLRMTGKIGDKIVKPGKPEMTRKQNVFEADFGAIALDGSLYGKIDGQEYDIYLVPKAKASK